MPKPHLCPKCQGEARIPKEDGRGAYTAVEAGLRACPVCKGAGVLWGPARQDPIPFGSDSNLPMRRHELRIDGIFGSTRMMTSSPGWMSVTPVGDS